MSYSVHNFAAGQVLSASQLNQMDAQISLNAKLIYPNGTDDTTAIQGALNSTGVAYLGEGTFNITTVTLPDNAIIRGFGRKTVVKTIGNVDALVLGKYCTVEDLEIVGTVSAKQTTRGTASGIVLTSVGVMNTKISGCTIHGFTECGIKFYETGDATQDSANVLNCEIYHCWCGIYTRKSEYNRFVGIITRYSHYGALNLGGNNTFTGCSFGKNDIGFSMDMTGETVSNTAHGSCVNCTFNHCDTYGIDVNGTNNTFNFVGCQMWYAPVHIVASKGILFVGCTIGTNTTFDVDSSSTLAIDDSIYTVAPTEYDNVIHRNCILQNGNRLYDVAENIVSSLTRTGYSASNNNYAYRIGKQVTLQLIGKTTAAVAHDAAFISGLPKPERDVYGYIIDYAAKSTYFVKLTTGGALKNVSGAAIATNTTICGTISYVCA